MEPCSANMKDDETGEELVIRPDDQEQTVRKRLSVYHEQTEPLVEYYQKLSEEGKTEYHKIDGTQPVDKVSEQLWQAMLWSEEC